MMKHVLFFIVLIGMYQASCAMECEICLEPLGIVRHMKLACAHCYHEECWCQWENKERKRIIEFTQAKIEFSEISAVSCPTCKRPFNRSCVIYGGPENKLRNFFSRLVNVFRPEPVAVITPTDENESH